MVAAKKKPQDRSVTTSRGVDDPRFIAVAKGHSRREGIPIPGANPKWKPSAQSWFRSLALSGQSDFFEASDWATAVAAAEAYDVFLRTYNASILAQFVRLTERLGCTISDRKRARIELDEPTPTDADEDYADDVIDDWHGKLYAIKGTGE